MKLFELLQLDNLTAAVRQKSQESQESLSQSENIAESQTVALEYKNIRKRKSHIGRKVYISSKPNKYDITPLATLTSATFATLRLEDLGTGSLKPEPYLDPYGSLVVPFDCDSLYCRWNSRLMVRSTEHKARQWVH